MSAFASIVVGDRLDARIEQLLNNSSPGAILASTRLETLNDDARAAQAYVAGLGEQLDLENSKVRSRASALAQIKEDAYRLGINEDVDADGNPIRKGLAVGVEGAVNYGDPRVRRSEIFKLEADLRRAEESRARMQSKVDEAKRAARAAAQPFEISKQALFDHKGSRLEVSIPPKPPRGLKEPGEILAHVVPELPTVKGRRAEVQKAPHSAETEKAILKADLDAIVADSGVRAFKGKIGWPVGAGKYSSTPGDQLRVRGLIAYFNYDAILEDLYDQVDANYQGVKTMTAKEKAAELSRLDQQLEDLQRMAAAAVWQAREEGHSIPFPAGLSGKAILGIA